MKTTININGKDVEIELTAEQIKVITDATVNPLEIIYTGSIYYATSQSSIQDYKIQNIPSCPPTWLKNIIEFGVVRKTSELVAQNVVRIIQSNKLQELVDWLEPDYNLNWVRPNSTTKWYIGYDVVTSKFIANCNVTTRTIGTIYMSEHTAITIRAALNEGRLPELASQLIK